MPDPTITGVLARVHVDDLDAALPLYVRLADDAPVQRFGFGEVRLAWVGPFLLIENGPDAVRAATILVGDVAVVATEIVDAGGELLDGPAEGPNGPRLIARHPDGAVFEYIQPR